MWKFLNDFKPSSISQLAGYNEEKELPLFTYPWVDFNSRSKNGVKDVLNSRFAGPSSTEFIQSDYARTLRLYKNIKSKGYNPYKFPNSKIGGTFLKNKNGDIRFIVMQGNHRMAILAHLGISSLSVRACSKSPSFVNENQIDSWSEVKCGNCGRDHAQKIFDYFFSEKGHTVRDIIL